MRYFRLFKISLIFGVLATLVACKGGLVQGASDIGNCLPLSDYFAQQVWAPLMSTACVGCHSADGSAATTRLVLQPGDDAATALSNFETVKRVAQLQRDQQSLLVVKATAQTLHWGGRIVEPGSNMAAVLSRFAARVQDDTTCFPQQTAMNPAMNSTSLPPISKCIDNRPAPRLLRRLTGAEYNATLRDLFHAGAEGPPQATFFNDLPVYAFQNNAGVLMVGGALAQELMRHAENVAAWARNNLAFFMPCTTHDAACAQQFVRSFGQRALRAPLSDAEVQLYTALFNGELAAGDFTGAVEQVVAAMLQSPGFLYRFELGVPSPTDATRYNLTPYEVASELSYFFTGSMPDDALFAAAASGALASPDGIAVQAQRLMLGSGKTLMQPFMFSLLKLDKLPNITKDVSVYDLSAPLRDDMAQETGAFLDDLVYTKNGTLSDLFGAENTWINNRLAAFYGLPSPQSDVFVQVSTPSGRAPGILGHGGVLTVNADPSGSSPTLRGKLIRERVFCREILPPPPTLDTTLKDDATIKTTRQRFEAHALHEPCKSCHDLMDPIGFGFEGFDGAGRARTEENGTPVDTRGTVQGVYANDVPFAGPSQLVALIASSDEAKQCMARNMVVYAYGLTTWPQDACTLNAVTQDANGSGFALQQLMLAITRAASFRERVSQ